MTNKGYVSGKNNSTMVMENEDWQINMQKMIKWAEISINIAKLIMNGLSTENAMPKKVGKGGAGEEVIRQRGGWKKGDGKKIHGDV